MLDGAGQVPAIAVDDDLDQRYQRQHSRSDGDNIGADAGTWAGTSRYLSRVGLIPGSGHAYRYQYQSQDRVADGDGGALHLQAKHSLLASARLFTAHDTPPTCRRRIWLMRSPTQRSDDPI